VSIIEKRICKKHGETDFVQERSGSFRCKKCRCHATSERRKNNKKDLIVFHGGKCQICGYNKYARALHFHHLGKKDFSIADKGKTLAFKKLLAESQKCILVCANCHSELHAGLIDFTNT
jgi:hypothetical protein